MALSHSLVMLLVGFICGPVVAFFGARIFWIVVFLMYAQGPHVWCVLNVPHGDTEFVPNLAGDSYLARWAATSLCMQAHRTLQLSALALLRCWDC